MKILVFLVLLACCKPSSAFLNFGGGRNEGENTGILGAAGDILNAGVNIVHGVATGVVNTAENVANTAVNTVGGVINTGVEILGGAAHGIVNTAENILGTGINILGQGANGIIDAAGNILGAGLGILDGAANAVVDAAGNIIGTGVSILGHGANEIIDAAGNVISTVLNIGNIWKPDTDLDHGHSTGTVVPCPAVADIYFVLDASGSVGAKNFATQLQFAKRITEHFIIGPADVQFGFIVFSNSPQKRFELTTFRDHVSLGQAIANIPYSAGGTKTYLALDLISNEGLLTTAKGARARSSKIVIVITDGISDNYLKTKWASDKLTRSGVQVIAVGVGLSNPFELNAIASGFLSNAFTTFGYNKLFEIEQKLARRTCEIPTSAGFLPIPTQPPPVTCIAGFTNDPANPQRCVDIDECHTYRPCEQLCTNTLGGYVCTCQKGFTVSEYNPLRCQEVQKCTAVVDIYFVMDSSGSIGENNYKLQLDFIAKFAGHFTVSGQGVRFGAIVFSNSVHKLFDLNTFSTSEQVQSSLRNAPYLKGQTYTNKALDALVQYNLFSAAAGGRDHAQKIVMVVTDGASTEPQLTQQSGQLLKSKGVKLFALGIGQGVDNEELSKLASTPQDYIYVNSFNNLAGIEERIADQTCTNVNGKK